jgi:uncharacterized protein (TIGR02597 family)
MYAKFLTVCLCAAWLAGGGSAGAQVTSPIVGYLTLNLQEGTNFIGFALLPEMELQAAFNVDATDRRVLTLSGGPGLSLADNQFSAGPLASHSVEVITAGAGFGFQSVITATSSTGPRITLQDPMPAGVSNGSTLKVWRLWTIGEVFGAANDAGLTGGQSPSEADLILLAAGTDFDRYFYSTGGAQGVGWRRVGGGSADQADVPFLLTEGSAIVARSAKAVTILGQVKPGAAQISLQTGNNYVANLCPVNAGGDSPSAVGRTLANSGLAAGLAGGVSSRQADLVLIWSGGGYDQYFYSTGGAGGVGWRKIGAGSADQDGVPLPDGAFVILRRGPPVTVILNQGTF